jgi:hypothetical protein
MRTDEFLPGRRFLPRGSGWNTVSLQDVPCSLLPASSRRPTRSWLLSSDLMLALSRAQIRPGSFPCRVASLALGGKAGPTLELNLGSRLLVAGVRGYRQTVPRFFLRRASHERKLQNNSTSVR